MNRSIACASIIAVILTVLPPALIAPPAGASDHADPVDPLMIRRADGTLTGLFAFPTQNRRRDVEAPEDPDGLVLILCVHRALATEPPYPGLDEYTFRIFVDATSQAQIAAPAADAPLDEAQRATARYGGVVVRPESIQESIIFEMKLQEDATFAERSATLLGPEGERRPLELAERDWWAGVRDDPFIFPQFFGTNVVAMVVHLPFERLPGDPRDFLIWATSERRGAQVDHVGRAQRTQLPRFEFLNTLHPRDHTRALRTAHDDPGLRQDISQFVFPTEFRIRPYDLQPDVMIYSRRFAPGYPNGRRLEDDIAKLACEQGDCQLYELSFAQPISPASLEHARYVGGRPTANDKPFLTSFPYLAEPWDHTHPAPPPRLTAKNRLILVFLALLAAGVVLLPWALYFRALGRLRSLDAEAAPARRR